MDNKSMGMQTTLLSFFVILLPFAFSSMQTLTTNIHMKEELPKGQHINNLVQMFNLTSRPKQDKFKVLSQKVVSSQDGIKFSRQIRTNQVWVSIDSASGDITLERRINRDSLCVSALCALELQVIKLPQQLLLEFNIIVDDINDNSPVFPHDVIDISIPESWAVGESYNLDAYMAKDKDLGTNGKIQYKLTENSYFGLKQYSGKEGTKHLQIFLINKLDYETKSEIDLTLVASDGGLPTLSSSSTLRISIADVNDNRPVFQQEKYTVTLKENQLPGQEIVKVQAVDADSDSFGRVQYYLSKRNDRQVEELLSVNAESGEVTLKEKLDRERDNGMRILIEARDSNPSDQRVGETYLVINIEDINDNAPLINVNYVVSSKLDTAYVSENAAIGTYIARVSATDADDGNNGRVTVAITSSPANDRKSPDQKTTPIAKNFKLNSNGFIETLEEMDRETCNHYLVTISACDEGNTPRCSSKTLDVVVLDVNEYAPKFIKPTQKVLLREDVNVGIDVATVHAEDKDNANGQAMTTNSNDEIVISKNGDITYSITSGGRGVFAIDPKSGRISLVRQLDREVKSEWILKVSAMDGGIPVALESTCEVIIKVVDVNDNRPFFVNPSINNSLVYASINRKEIITQLRAVDYDDEKYTHLRYHILSTDDISENMEFSQPSRQATFHTINQTARGLLAQYRNKDFILNPISGELHLNLTRANSSMRLGLKRLKIQVCDSHVPKLCSNIVLRVMVTKEVILTNDVDYNKVSSSPDLVILAVSLGSVAVLLIVLIAVVVIKCTRQNKEIRSYNIPTETNRADYSVGKSCGCDDVTSNKDDIDSEKCPLTPETKVSTGSQRESLQSDIEDNNKSHVNLDLLSPPAHLMKKLEKLPSSHSDGDSGRGDSEPDSSCFHASDRKGSILSPRSKMNNRMSLMCSEQCLKFGHSDKCWMPKSDNITSSRCSISSIKNEKVYNWQRLKPKYYESPTHNEAIVRSGHSDSDLLSHTRQPPQPQMKNQILQSFQFQQPDQTINDASMRPSSLSLLQRRYSASVISHKNTSSPAFVGHHRESQAPRSCQSTPCEFLPRRGNGNAQLNTVYEDTNHSPSRNTQQQPLKYLNDRYRVSQPSITITQSQNINNSIVYSINKPPLSSFDNNYRTNHNIEQQNSFLPEIDKPPSGVLGKFGDIRRNRKPVVQTKFVKKQIDELLV